MQYRGCGKSVSPTAREREIALTQTFHSRLSWGRGMRGARSSIWTERLTTDQKVGGSSASGRTEKAFPHVKALEPGPDSRRYVPAEAWRRSGWPRTTL